MSSMRHSRYLRMLPLMSGADHLAMGGNVIGVVWIWRHALYPEQLHQRDISRPMVAHSRASPCRDTLVLQSDTCAVCKARGV
jgi:hypothetical protein